TVSLTVDPVNDAPIAVDHELVILEDDSITMTATELLAGAAAHFDPQFSPDPWDETNQELRITSLTYDGDVIDDSATYTTLYGTLNVTFASTDAGLGLEELTYTPNAHFNVDNPRTDVAGMLLRTLETFTYTVADDGIAVLPQDESEVQQSQLTTTATLTIEVKPQNDAPVAGDDEISVGLAGSTRWEDYFAGLPEPTSPVAPTEDTTLVIPTAFLLENDAVGPVGADDELNGVNDNDGQKSLVTDADILDTLSPGLAFPLTTAQGGTVIVNGNGDLEYTPAADYYGPDSFTYWVGDQGVDEDVDGVRTDNPRYTEATVSLIVEPANDAPIAVDHGRVILEDESITVTAAELLGGAAAHFDPQIAESPWDETNQELRVTSLTIGDVVIDSSGTFT
ncbi:MAG: Ig-like domain-containing protein, partial [Pirellulaceae bacterium]